MVNCPEHHGITFSFLLIIRALLDFFLLLACPCPYHKLLPWLKQCAVVIHHTTVQLMNKRHVTNSIQIKSLYCHNTMNASVQVVKVFCANCSMTLWMTNIEYIYIYRAVVKSTFVESKTSPRPGLSSPSQDRVQRGSSPSQVQVQRGSSPSQVQVQMRQSKQRKK